jgi:hypothetical protein
MCRIRLIEEDGVFRFYHIEVNTHTPPIFGSWDSAEWGGWMFGRTRS